MTFKVGDRVRALASGEYVPAGALGKVLGVSNHDAFVEWDADSGAKFDHESEDYRWHVSLILLQLVAPAKGLPEYEQSPRAALLNEAKSLITGDRNNQYGPPTQDFTRTAEFWTTYLGDKLAPGEKIEAHDMAIMMTLLKVSRIAWEPTKQDSWADASGYVACGWECVVDEAIEERM